MEFVRELGVARRRFRPTSSQAFDVFGVSQLYLSALLFMDNEENNQSKANPKVISNVLMFLGISVVLILLILIVFKSLRNRNCWELGERFVRNNEVIKQEVGNIRRFGKTAQSEGINWEITGKVYGESKTTEITISAFKGEDGGGCTISTVKFKDEKGTWNEIPVGWFDNLLLTFK